VRQVKRLLYALKKRGDKSVVHSDSATSRGDCRKV
jgi:hypothetical protein